MTSSVHPRRPETTSRPNSGPPAGRGGNPATSTWLGHIVELAHRRDERLRGAEKGRASRCTAHFIVLLDEQSDGNRLKRGKTATTGIIEMALSTERGQWGGE